MFSNILARRLPVVGQKNVGCCTIPFLPAPFALHLFGAIVYRVSSWLTIVCWQAVCVPPLCLRVGVGVR